MFADTFTCPVSSALFLREGSGITIKPHQVSAAAFTQQKLGEKYSKYGVLFLSKYWADSAPVSGP